MQNAMPDVVSAPRQGFPASDDPQDEHAARAMVREGLDKGNVMLAFQPVMQTRRPDRPAFHEGLIRLVDEDGQIIPAQRFIAAVEATDLGRRIDCAALNLGLEALSQYPSLRLSLNLSSRTIGHAPWMLALSQGLDRDPTIAERLILEITEASAMRLPAAVAIFMQSLQAQGICFALDDFGAGYTAFRHFRDFRFDIVKIDGQFIRGIHRDKDNQVLTRALVSIAQHSEMFTVAEFVETAADAAFLTEMGIDCLQGYYFGPPTLAPAFLERSLRRHA